MFPNCELDIIKQQGLFRQMKRIDGMQGPTVSIDGREVLLFSSNNYLGLAGHPEVIAAQMSAAEAFGAGSGASRLVSGNMTLHEALEARLAEFKGADAAAVFATGYMANVGAIGAVVAGADVVVCDKLSHASIIDGARMSGAAMRIYPHKNLGRCEEILKKASGYRRRLIVTDCVFSMDGDIAPIPALAGLAQKYDAILMVDYAHSTGVLDDKKLTEGVHIQMGTLSKALGNLGGFIAGSKTLIEYIRNRARSFIYSTALPPAILGGAIKALEIVEKDIILKDRLWYNVTKFRSALTDLGYDTMDSNTQIIPIHIGDADATMRAADFLFKNNIFAPGIRPPTVPKNKCRIRTSLMATHTDEHIDRAIDVFRRLKNEGILRNRDRHRGWQNRSR